MNRFTAIFTVAMGVGALSALPAYADGTVREEFHDCVTRFGSEICVDEVAQSNYQETPSGILKGSLKVDRSFTITSEDGTVSGQTYTEKSHFVTRNGESVQYHTKPVQIFFSDDRYCSSSDNLVMTKGEIRHTDFVTICNY